MVIANLVVVEHYDALFETLSQSNVEDAHILTILQEATCDVGLFPVAT